MTIMHPYIWNYYPGYKKCRNETLASSFILETGKAFINYACCKKEAF